MQGRVKHQQQIKRLWECVLQARLKSGLGCTYTTSGEKKVGKQRNWVTRIHSKKREKKEIGWFEPM